MLLILLGKDITCLWKGAKRGYVIYNCRRLLKEMSDSEAGHRYSLNFPPLS
jgi:hypothetical protein